jgi:arginyl-tRNA synthetase
MIYSNIYNKHISFGLVNTPEGKMKSRAGDMFLYEDLRDTLFDKVKEVLKSNDLDTDNDIVNNIVFGTIKFELLKISTQKNIIFDINSAIDLTGDSSAYIQYSGVRAKSILEKSNSLDISIKDIKNTKLEKDEINLLRKINQFSEKIESAAINYKPNIIANYCIEISHLFNKFYTNCQVLSEDENIKKNRLLLVKSYFITLKNALYLLGINIPKKM